jgi:hypothetical protein
MTIEAVIVAGRLRTLEHANQAVSFVVPPLGGSSFQARD